MCVFTSMLCFLAFSFLLSFAQVDEMTVSFPLRSFAVLVQGGMSVDIFYILGRVVGLVLVESLFWDCALVGCCLWVSVVGLLVVGCCARCLVDTENLSHTGCVKI